MAEMICKLQWFDGWKGDSRDEANTVISNSSEADEKIGSQLPACDTQELRNKVASLESFSYTLCHDLRAPLRAILAFTEALQQDAGHKLSSTDQDYLCRIATAGTRMNRLIDDLLAYSHSSERCPPVEKVHVDSLVAEVISYAQSSSNACDFRVSYPLLPVLGNKILLLQCLQNLVGNAVKFTTSKAPQIAIWTRQNGSKVRIFVQDNGIGIESESLARIFQPFERLHADHDGFGLGLAIVKHSIEKIGGTIGVDSVPGEGSTFWLDLPAAVELESGKAEQAPVAACDACAIDL